MKKKTILSVIAAVAVVAVCGGLAFSHFKAAGNEVDLKKTNKLKVYVYKNDNYINYILGEFAKYYSDIDVERVNFDNYDQYIAQIKQDAGKKGGPDIIFDANGNGINLRKMQMDDKLVDLKPLLQMDKEFVFEDYNDAVFNSCSYDGKLTAVPFYYMVPAFYAGDKTFDSNALKKGYSLKDLADAADKYGSDKKIKFTNRDYVYQIIGASGVDFIDYKNKKLINEDKLKEVMKYCKKFYSKDMDKIKSMKGTADALKNKEVLFTNIMPGTSILTSTVTDSGYKQFAGENANVYAMPSLKGGNEYNAMAAAPLCIPKSAVNKKSALDFIEFCLSSPMQNTMSTSQCIAVRIEDYINGFKSARQNLTEPEPITDDSGKETSETLQLNVISDDLSKSTKDIINKAKKCRYLENESYRNIYEGVEKYISSDISEDKALSEIKDGLNKYFKN